MLYYSVIKHPWQLPLLDAPIPLTLRFGAFQRCLNDNQGKLERNEMRGPPNGLCGHMRVLLQSLHTHARCLGRVGSKYGHFDVVRSRQ